MLITRNQFKPLKIVSLVIAFILMGAGMGHADMGYTKFTGSSGPEEEGVYVVTTPEGWHKLWSMVGKPAKATFKPGKHTGVAVFLGPRPDGDRLRVRKVQDDDGRMEVKMTHKRGTPSGETITPWAMVLIDGTGEEATAVIQHEAQALN